MSGYDRELVERLVPAIWDPAYCYGMDNPSTPDPEMPRQATDPTTANTLYAHLADIKMAWQYAPVNLDEARALLMHYGLGWQHVAVAVHEGVNKSTALRRSERGVSKLVAYLNGTTYEGDDEGDCVDPKRKCGNTHPRTEGEISACDS